MLWKKFSSSPLHLRVFLSFLTFLHVIHTSVKGSKKIWKQGKLDCRGMSKIIFIYQEAFVNTILIIIFFVFRRKDTFYQMQVHTPFYYVNYQNYLDNLYGKTSTIKNEEK